MDCFEVCIDKIEVQWLMGVFYDIEFVLDFFINFRLLDFYNFFGEYVEMYLEIFSVMRVGNIEYLERMKSYGILMVCFKSDLGDLVFYFVVVWGYFELVKSLVFECLFFLLELNGKGQFFFYVVVCVGYLVVVEVFILFIIFFVERFFEEGREKLNLFVLKDEYGDIFLYLVLKDFYEKIEVLYIFVEILGL